jgi:lipopolysaccharide transport system ATP-binding protein
MSRPLHLLRTPAAADAQVSPPTVTELAEPTSGVDKHADCSIELVDAQLHYLSDAFRQRSLKAAAFNLLKGRSTAALRDVHALRGVTLRISRGERVGLIGHNGAGKSTLLKAIADIYPLSGGVRKVVGEVRALLELSLGFESEATGRENVAYRALLLGVHPATIRELAPSIIEFSDLGEFIDYPVKTYSAGMMVRLAFAISTAIGGEILLLDEILGAGDITFMKKAKDRIESLISDAKILLLATHNLASIQDLCNRVLVMDHGCLIYDGPVEVGIARYTEA